MELYSINPVDKQWQFIEKNVNTQEKNENILSTTLQTSVYIIEKVYNGAYL